MSRDAFQDRIDSWINDESPRPQRARRALKALYYNKLPKHLRLFSVAHWLTKTALASSAPGLAYFYGTIKLGVAVVLASVIFLWHVLVGVFDRLSSDKAAGEIDSHSEMLVRLGDLLMALRANSTASPNRDEAITACLGVLDIFARQITKSAKGEISVSLVLYAGNSSTRMKIRHRNPGNDRPRNRDLDSRRMLGHHACLVGAFPRVVHDIREFGRGSVVSPTQSKIDYRSIFIIPIESRRDSRMVGFVSLDCRRPYAFYGNRANVIIVTCEPVINHIRDLI